MSIASKLQKILDSKAAIKTAINGKGGTITDSTPLDEYADAIDGLPSGDDSALRDLIDGSITTIEIPAGATEVRDSAFRNCTSLTSVTIPDSVIRIGTFAFQNTAIVNFNSNKAQVIDTSAFDGLQTTRRITIGEGCTTIGNYAFRSNVQATHFFLPSTLTSIGKNGMYLYNYGAVYPKIIIAATTPPTIMSDTFVAPTSTQASRTSFYVPDEAVNTYKTATNWSAYASRIFPMSDYTE